MADKLVFSLANNIISPSFIASADIHLGKKLYLMPELEEDLKDNFTRLADMAVTRKVDYLVIAGDLYEDNRNIKPNTIAFVANTVERLKKHGITTVGIAGDHDKPVLGESWIRISDISPVTIEPTFAGLDYFDYSSVEIDDLVKLMKQNRNCDKVLWLFLHCQFPQLFEKSEPKKMIDYNRLRIFDNFPNIQGVIAGDLHFAPETRAYGLDKEAYVGYPGSLGINDKSEYKHDKHVLYCDGKSLYHVDFPLLRKYKEIDFRNKNADEFDVIEHIDWAKLQKLKPIIFVAYDSQSHLQLKKIEPLYQYALIKPFQVPVGAVDLDEAIDMSSRTESTSNDKIEKALRYYCNNDETLFNLSYTLLTEDVKTTLDGFKEQYDL